MSGEKIILDYAQGPPRWRKWVLRGTLAAVLLLLIGAGWYWRIDISRHLSAWYWQRQCLAFSLPPDEVILEKDPIAAKKLLAARPRDYQPMHTAQLSALRITDCWRQLAPNCTNFAYWPSAAVFAHERISRGAGGGNARLVVVMQYDLEEKSGLMLRTSVLRKGTILRLPEKLSLTGDGFGRSNLAGLPDPKTRIYAGQPDPADPSHFTIDYEQWGQRDTADAWLEANDTVKFQTRHYLSPPAAVTPP